MLPKSGCWLKPYSAQSCARLCPGRRVAAATAAAATAAARAAAGAVRRVRYGAAPPVHVMEVARRALRQRSCSSARPHPPWLLPSHRRYFPSGRERKGGSARPRRWEWPAAEAGAPSPIGSSRVHRPLLLSLPAPTGAGTRRQRPPGLGLGLGLGLRLGFAKAACPSDHFAISEPSANSEPSASSEPGECVTTSKPAWEFVTASTPGLVTPEPSVTISEPSASESKAESDEPSATSEPSSSSCSEPG
eukprot:scaffold10924_cov51-Phaeocystis_antarctica.AAC.5